MTGKAVEEGRPQIGRSWEQERRRYTVWRMLGTLEESLTESHVRGEEMRRHGGRMERGELKREGERWKQGGEGWGDNLTDLFVMPHGALWLLSEWKRTDCFPVSALKLLG